MQKLMFLKNCKNGFALSVEPQLLFFAIFLKIH